ncbi:hypothetical protein PISMIDRAFT_20175 [Pisolithus microcarpus 441]|uniref:Uncharacterized protein n=1 Tax=Pisolithus microcarpus 441 TaxID=765257 RepID=A0A0C9Y0F3_9AGAM|nr:hypothetical protein BKA83DRAFT_20175 [Pisolithus microcarpus]KIK10696.1 hypothetical protein PISMIDRAFT_20175 [Pisolithus microcarpus 441]
MSSSSLSSPVTATAKIPKRVFTPFTASEVDRYNRGNLIQPSKEFPKVTAGKRTFDDTTTPNSAAWKACAHPEGALYFCDIRRRIYTDSDVRDDKTRRTIEKCILRLAHLAKPHSIIFPSPSLELVLELTKGKRKECRYYFVDGQKRLLFWMHDWVPKKMYANLRGVKDPSHITDDVVRLQCVAIMITEIALEMQYWMHCELYPHQRTFDTAIYRELCGLIIHANAESITSDTSLAPFESAELSKMMDIMRVLKDSTEQVNDPLFCVVARFMCIFSRIHFLNFHGQPHARLDVDRTVYHSPVRRRCTSILLRMLSLILFGAPWRYVETLRGVWVDETVNLPRWRAFVGNILNEWGGFTIYSTVMLAVDVSLLAIIHTDTTTYQSAKYMTEITDTVIGVDNMAIMFSVPFGLLIWGMASFLVAFLYLIFSSSYLPTLATTTPGIILVTVLVAWPVWVAMERSLGQWMKNAVNIWHGVVRTGWEGKGWGSQSLRSWRERGESLRAIEIRRGSVGTIETGILETGSRRDFAPASLGREGRKTVSWAETPEDVQAHVGVGAGFGTENDIRDLQASEDASEPQPFRRTLKESTRAFVVIELPSHALSSICWTRA